MLDGLSLGSDWTPWSILGLAVVMILLGWLVPKRAVDRVERDRDHWREASESKDRTIAELVKQVDVALEQGRTTNQLLSSLPRPPEGKT